MKIKCINKNRNNSGVIVNYVLQDETGRIFQATASEIKREMKQNRYRFVNLQIDKAGRLVDKSTSDIKAKLMSKLRSEISSAISRIDRGENIEFAEFRYRGNIHSFETNHKMFTLISKDDELAESYMTDLIDHFETLLHQRPDIYKVHIRSNDGAFEIVHFSKTGKVLVGDLLRGNTNNPYYFNPANYSIRVYEIKTKKTVDSCMITVSANMDFVYLNKQNNKQIDEHRLKYSHAWYVKELFDNLHKQLKETGTAFIAFIDEGTGFKVIDNSTYKSDFISEMEDELDTNYMSVIPKLFDSYLRSESSYYMLHIKSKDGAFEVVQYFLSLNKFNFNKSLLKHLKNKAYYLNSSNYWLEAYHFNESGKTSISLNIAPDMSYVTAAQNVSYHTTKQNPNITLSKSTVNNGMRKPRFDLINELNKMFKIH